MADQAIRSSGVSIGQHAGSGLGGGTSSRRGRSSPPLVRGGQGRSGGELIQTTTATTWMVGISLWLLAFGAVVSLFS